MYDIKSTIGENVGEPLPFNNETAEAFMKVNDYDRTGIDDLYANGSIPPKHCYDEDGNV